MWLLLHFIWNSLLCYSQVSFRKDNSHSSYYDVVSVPKHRSDILHVQCIVWGSSWQSLSLYHQAYLLRPTLHWGHLVFRWIVYQSHPGPVLNENRVENFEARTRWIYGFRKTQNSSRNDLVICSLNSVAWYSSELRQRWDDVCMCSHESAPSRIINHAICFYKCWFIYIHICVYVYIITNTILRYHCTYFVFE